MGKPRNAAKTCLPAWVPPFTVVAGVLAMGVAQVLFRGFGLRPLLVGAETFLMLPALLALAAWRIPLGKGLAFRSLPPRAVALCLGLGATLWATSLGLFEVQYAVWKPPPGFLEAFERLHEMLKPDGPFDALVSLATIAFVPAFCEEIVFRGAALPAFLRRLGPAWAVVLSSLLFGLIHVEWAGSPSFYRVPFAFTIGMGLALLRLRTGSLWASLVAHATLNGITFFAAPHAAPTAGTLPEADPLLGAALLIGGLVGSAALFRFLPVLTPERPAP